MSLELCLLLLADMVSRHRATGACGPGRLAEPRGARRGLGFTILLRRQGTELELPKKDEDHERTQYGASILACLTLLTIATARADAIADCLTIKADPQRLACYDNAAKAAAEARAKSGQVRATSEAERILKAPEPASCHRSNPPPQKWPLSN